MPTDRRNLINLLDKAKEQLKPATLPEQTEEDKNLQASLIEKAEPNQKTEERPK